MTTQKILVILCLFLACMCSVSASSKQVYNTSGIYNFTIPTGVTAVNITAWGAGGGGGGGGSGVGATGGYGGGGGFASGLITVISGQTFNIIVGNGGSRGLFSSGAQGAVTGDGGGGGGFSVVNRSNSILIIAGGGGAGGGGDNSIGGAGGPGGAGGGNAGRAGSDSGSSTGGGGGNQTAGGYKGTSIGNNGTAGTSLTGGNGGSPTLASCVGGSAGNVSGGIVGGGNGSWGDVGASGGCAGGSGGGGGYFGGGGGAGSTPTDSGGAGGGGGSSYTTGSANYSTAGSGRNAANNATADYIAYSNKAGLGGLGGAVGGDGTNGTAGLIILIYDIAPVVSAVNITPIIAFKNSTLRGNYTFTDGDGDAENNSYFKWFVNGVINVSGRGNASNITTITNISRGSAVILEITPFSGSVNGTAVNSSELIINNIVPSVSNVTITPFIAYANSTLKGNYTYFDGDGEAENNSYFRWFINNSVNLSGRGNASNITNLTNVMAGSVVILEITPFDGVANGTAVNSSAVVIVECLIINSPCEGCRYRTNEINMSISCSTGSDVFYSLNHYSPVVWNLNDTILKTNFGWNTLCFNSTAILSSVCINFFSAGEGENSAYFVVVFIILIIGLVCGMSRNLFVCLVGGLLIVVCGIMFYAWSTWMFIVVVVFGLFMLFLGTLKRR